MTRLISGLKIEDIREWKGKPTFQWSFKDKDEKNADIRLQKVTTCRERKDQKIMYWSTRGTWLLGMMTISFIGLPRANKQCFQSWGSSMKHLKFEWSHGTIRRTPYATSIPTQPKIVSKLPLARHLKLEVCVVIQVCHISKVHVNHNHPVCSKFSQRSDCR